MLCLVRRAARLIRTNKKGELAIETREPINLTRDCAERDDIRDLNTALGITTKVAEPKVEHGGEESVLGRARSRSRSHTPILKAMSRSSPRCPEWPHSINKATLDT